MTTGLDSDNFRKAINGDREALSTLYLKYHGSLMHYGLRINSNKSIVEECIQDLFVNITVNGNRLGEIINIRAYFFTSLRREILRKLKKERRIVSIQEELSDQTDVSFTLEDLQHDNTDAQKNIQLIKLINQLSWRQKEAIYLRYFNNLSTTEIALIMNITNQTVLNTLYQALKKLKSSKQTIGLR